MITFGVDRPADVSARNIQYNETGQPRFDLVIAGQSIAMELQLMGEHNVHNALAAAAAGYAQGLSLSAIQAGLNTASAEKRRLVEQCSPEGAMIIDDSYNANPLSMRAAIQLLARRSGERILVIGDMRELGDHACQYHQEIGTEAKNLGIEQLYCYGDLSRYAADAFGKRAYFFSDRDQLIQALKPHLRKQVTVLIKGSNSMQMDQVVTALRESRI